MPDQAMASTPDEPTEAVDGAGGDPAEDEFVLEDLLVEDVSIDGMCGVY